ncbi:NADH-quinone oxidoreductase subunit H [bacterium]|nr:MAG: NADH-quinone oxidoreductase subunit H [bacterium]
MEWFLSLHPFWQALVRVLLWIGPLFLILPVLIWFERRLLGWFQDRIGPNRVGTITFSKRNEKLPSFLRGRKISLFGLMQSFADITKAMLKEDITPNAVDKFLFVIAPGLFMFPAFLLGATVPWGPIRALTPVADINIGVLFLLAASSLGVYGVVLAGYSSNNKYSLLGGLRSSAQLISYELSMTVSLAGIAMATGDLKFTTFVAAQEQGLWGFDGALANWFIFTPYGFIAAIVFGICMIAETNRPPFDLPEAENELVAGYNTEYTAKKWVLFMMGEYLGMLTYSAVFATVFLGGWHLAPIRWDWIMEHWPALAWPASVFYWIDANLAPVLFLGKMAVGICIYIWIRATLPRLRYDQLMNLGWRTLLPIATANLIVIATWLVVSRVWGVWAGVLSFGISMALGYLLYRSVNKLAPGQVGNFESRTIRMVEPEVVP